MKHGVEQSREAILSIGCTLCGFCYFFGKKSAKRTIRIKKVSQLTGRLWLHSLSLSDAQGPLKTRIDIDRSERQNLKLVGGLWMVNNFH